MAIDNSSTLVRRSTKRSSHENDFTWKNTIPFHRYAIVFQDKDGALKATGSDVFKDTSGWFTQDLREEFQGLLHNPSGQPTQSTSDHPAKRYRGSVDDADRQKAALKVLPDCSNTQQVTALYRRIFGRLRQIDCRSIGQAWIGLIAPNKQYTHPYNGGDKRKPKWWPHDVQHSSPHHLGSEDRVTLLIHILRMSGKGKTTCDELQKAAAHKTPLKAHEIIDEIFAIRENEEEVEEGGGQDGISATGATDEELNHGLIQVSGSASDGGRGRSPAGSPEDQIEEISLTSPSVESSPDFATPSSYPSTSEALANPMYSRGCQNQTPYPVSQSVSFRAPLSITKAPPTGVHLNKQQLVLGHLSWSGHTMHRQQSVQPIQLACHSCCPRNCFLMAQHNGFDPADSTAPGLSSSQQMLLSNPASYAHTTSHGLPQQSWPNENNNDNTYWDSFSGYWNHQRLPQNYPGFT